MFDDFQIDDDDLETLTIFTPLDETDVEGGPVSFEAWAEIQSAARALSHDDDRIREIEQAMLNVVSNESERQGWNK